MRRLLPLLLLLLGCNGWDTDGLNTEEVPPTAPPPIAITPGTLVVDNWQFRNRCQRDLLVDFVTDERTNPFFVEAGHVQYFEISCKAGDEVCATVTDVRLRECHPCAPGTRPPIDLRCE